MTSEYILLFLGKHRFRIVFISLLLIAVAGGFSYYITGRSYKASIDFYIINSSFFDGNSDDPHSNKLFPTAEEIEIIGSICKSTELFETVVDKADLTSYFKSNTPNDAIENLKKKTSITIGKKGKISVSVEDYDNKKAHQIAQHFMHAVYTSFVDKSKQVRNNVLEDLSSRIDNYNKQKEQILSDNFTTKKVTNSILEVSSDSLKNFKVLNRIQHKTGLEFQELLTIVSSIERLSEIDKKLFTLNDQQNKVEQSVKGLSRNNLIVLNNAIPFSKNVPWYEHLISGIKFTLLINAIWVSLMLLFKHYQEEIELFLKSNKV